MNEKKIFDFNLRYFLILVPLLYTALDFIMNFFVLNYTSYINTISDQINSEVAEAITNRLLVFQRLEYLFVPLAVCIKLLSVGLAVYIGIQLSNFSISFNEVLKIIILAEFVLFTGEVIRVLYFLHNGFQGFDQLKEFYPLSIGNFVNLNQFSKEFRYSFKFLNFFQLLYIFLLINLITIKLKSSFYQSAKLVLSTYGLLLVMWNILIIFLQLRFS
ncbi:hypothetical protein [Asinibacterium sp. OR53]|uniref:hypothetical protein n=1 Tax=Asinibacterium sp. OR53 TaxID=925409 RepID=UPI000479859E|nr:hypothetical protein [Asinibacterium sp. OR53]